MRQLSIGVDLGATNVRIGVVTRTGRILKREEYPLDQSRGGVCLAEELVSKVRNLLSGRGSRSSQWLGIGVGIAAAIDMRRGTIVNSPNIRGLNGFAMRDFLRKRISLPVVLENDANAFALGEGWVGAARGASDYCGITLGTGVGGGIVVKGAILHGSKGRGGEVGHMAMNPEGPPCGCGGRGCLEVYASASGIKRMALEAIERGEGEEILRRAGGERQKVNAEKVFEAARSGDRVAQEIFREMGRWLGLGLVNLIHLFDPEKIVIGGKVSRAWDLFIRTTMEVVSERVMEGSRRKVRIVRAQCGDDAGILGAAYACLKGGSIGFRTRTS